MNYYNKENFIRGARFQMLAELLGKRKHTIQIYFSKNKIDIFNVDSVKQYLLDNGYGKK